MIFNSLTFLLFFAVVMALHYAPFFSWHQKKINLMIASYLFYAAWNPPFVILLWVSTVVDWWAAQWMVRAKREGTRKAWMLTSVVVNLGMLGYFKYGGFLMDNFVSIAGSLGIIYHPPGWDIVLPVGISFYTFATLSYTLDVYLRRSAPAGSFLNYALFVTFFPHLVAAQPPLDRQIRAVQSAPDDERPVGAVPQPAEQHRSHQRRVGSRLAVSVPAEGNV
jgi:alginate O-acetyltransferase complex protein AlgI